MKKCFKCNEVKSLSEFYRHSEMKDGHLNKCKMCTKKDVRLDRKNSPNARLYDKKRWRESEKRRERQAKNTKIWREKYPEKYKAHNILNNAIRDKKIKKMNCEICGDKAHAHHDDYTKPLDVCWLCPIHHQSLHHRGSTEEIL